MRRYLLYSIIVALSLTSYAQSYDERIANAMNSSDWFALDSIYNEVPKDSISPFLEIFSRCLIGNRLNRPDVSVPAFDELFRNHAGELDLGNLLNTSMMFSMDLSRIGENKPAADLLSTILLSTQEHLDSAWIAAMRDKIDLYTSLSELNPYGISFDDNADGKIPFKIIPVGPEDKNSVLMHLENSYINGNAADITFDTGAGVNVISDSLARKYGLIPLDAQAKVAGLGIQSGYHAIAKELKIGNITLTDVPFSVMGITSGNEEADKYIDHFMIIVGSEMMLQLKDLTVDFINREIVVPRSAPVRSSTPPNMCFSSGMNLLARATIHGDTMLMCIDTGDASYGSLNSKFFDDNKDYVTSHAQLDTIRSAGIGGFKSSQCYRAPDMVLQLGGCHTVIPDMVVGLGENPSSILDYKCNLGLKTLMRFGKIRFNMVDFILTTYSEKTPDVMDSVYATSALMFTGNKERSILQSVGLVMLSVANGLCNDNAPAAPDL